MSELDRLAILGRAMRLAAAVLAMVVIVGSASWLGMWRPHPAQPVATTMASQARVPQPLTVGPGGSDLPLGGGTIDHALVPDLYVVPGVGNFVYLEPGHCYCLAIAYPSDTIFVRPSPDLVEPCRCIDSRGMTPIVPIIHIVSPALPCRCVDTRLTAPSTT
jgi:hypothetical protein